jgi:hypothetical protein
MTETECFVPEGSRLGRLYYWLGTQAGYADVRRAKRARRRRRWR